LQLCDGAGHKLLYTLTACGIGWADVGTMTKVSLGIVISSKNNENSYKNVFVV
jgi:hypothetical protein